MGIDKIAAARLDGMDYALRKIKSDGIDAFEDEMRMRNRNGISFPATKKEEKTYQHYATKCILTMMLYCLHDVYGFGAKRCQDVMTVFNARCGAIVRGLVSWSEIADELQTELGFEVMVE